MAKFCAVCNQSYADEFETCPFCAAHEAGGMDVDDPGQEQGGRPGGTPGKATTLGPGGAGGARATTLGPGGAGGSKATTLGAGVEGGKPTMLGGDLGEAGGTPSSEDSSIDLGHLARDPGSRPRLSSSDADLLKQIPAEQPPPASFAKPPSDILADLAHATGEEPPADEDELVGELFRVEPTPPPRSPATTRRPGSKPSDSMLDLGAMPGDPGGSGPRPEESEVFMAELASDASQVELVEDVPSSINLKGPHAGAPVAEDALEMPARTPARGEDPSSHVNLSDPDIVAGEELPEMPSAPPRPPRLPPRPRRFSEVDLGGLEVPPPSHPELPVLETSAVDLGAHPDVQEAPPSGTSGPVPADSSISLGHPDEPARSVDSGLALDYFLSDSGIHSPPKAPADELQAEEAIEAHEPLSAEEAASDFLAEASGEHLPAAGHGHGHGHDDLFAATAEEEPPFPAADEPLEAAEEPEMPAEEEPALAAEEEPALEEEPVGAGRGPHGRPAAPVRQRSRFPAFLAGGVLGSLVVAGAWVGLVLGGLDPAPKLQELAGTPAKTSSPANTSIANNTPRDTSGPAPQRAPLEWIQYGEYHKAQEAGLDKAPASTPEELARRGELRWLSYLQAQAQAGKPVQMDDPAVKAALDDLQQASAQVPEALYWLGYISERGKDLKKAAQYYKQGLDQFKEPGDRQRFQAALDRIELQTGGADVGAWANPADRDRLLLALLLTSLQLPDVPPGNPPPGNPPPGNPPAPGQPEPQANPEEAGASFWQALRNARTQNYAKAVEAIDRARKVHDDRRFLRLRKAQNPLTDPTEEIFLQACDQLHAYWTLQEKLSASGLVERGQSPEQALASITKKLKQAKENEKLVEGLAGQLIEAKVIDAPAGLADGVTQLLTDRQAAAKKITGLQGDVKKAKEDTEALQDKLTKAEDSIAQGEKKLKEAAAREEKLTQSVAAAEAVVKKVGDQLVQARYADASAGPDEVLAGLKKALAMAAIVDPQGLIRRLQAQVKQDDFELKRRRSPEEMLNIWLPVLQAQRQRTDLATDALEDAQRVSEDPRVIPAQKAKAELLRGLVLRNQEKLEEARTVIGDARAQLPDQGEWLAQANLALAEVANPAAHYLQRVDLLYNQGKLPEALAALKEVMRRLPKEEGALLARRSLLELEIAQGRSLGRLRARDADVEQAAKDAAAAVAKGAAAAGHFAAGRVSEELGQYPSAVQSYRQAVAAHPAIDTVGSEYRMALARVLVEQQNAQAAPPVVQQAPAPPPLQPLPPTPADPAPRPAADVPPLPQPDRAPPKEAAPDREPAPDKEPAPRKEPAPDKEPAPEKEARRPQSPLQALKVSWQVPAPCPAEDVQALAVLGLLALQAPDRVGMGAPDEAERLADEVLRAAPGAVPFHVRAQALVIKGRWTTALQVYAEGVRPYLPRAYSRGLLQLILSHPRLRQPDILRVPSPYEGEQRFSAGLTFYFNGEFANAEREFMSAVENFNLDARYYYFLGLARMAQQKREYIMDFEQGALLERQNRPPSGVISISLERVQGPERYRLNEIRRLPR